MMYNEQMMYTKEKLLAEIESLPDHRVAEVLDYIYFLQYQERHWSSSEFPMVAVTDTDPLDQFIGGIEHGHLAQRIDDGLYTS